MFYIKNVPNWERGLRFAISTAVGVAGVNTFGFTLYGIAILAGAVGFALTAVVGWCPMCAMVGRKLK